MRRIRVLLFGGGAAVLIWLVLHVGPSAIAESITRVTGWQFALICLAHGLAMAVDTVGWRYAFTRDRVPFLRLLAARTAGEAINLVTVLASVGGEAVKTWILRRDVPYEESVPSVIVAKTAAVVSQAIFLLFGLLISWTILSWDSPFMTGLLWLLLIEVAAIGGFMATQVTGLIQRAGRLFGALGMARVDGSVARLDHDLRRYYREHWRRFLASIGWHALGGALAVVETFLIMHSIGLHASLFTAVVVDSLGAGIRFATFLVPASLGALESGNAAAFAALGYGAGAGLVFTLVRRARQVVWIGLGICVLVLMGARAKQPQQADVAPADRATPGAGARHASRGSLSSPYREG